MHAKYCPCLAVKLFEDIATRSIHLRLSRRRGKMNIRYRVELSEAERSELGSLLRGGQHAARKLKRAQILLAADAGVPDETIAQSLGVGGSTVYRTKRHFVEGTLGKALHEESRPGGNTTGVAILSNELAAKRLALVHEMLPEARTVAVLINSDFGPSGRFRSDIEAAAPALGLVVRFLQANSEAEIDAAFASLATAHADALLVGPGPFLDSRRNLLVERAAKAAIPASYETRATALAGGLVSYGSDV